MIPSKKVAEPLVRRLLHSIFSGRILSPKPNNHRITTSSNSFLLERFLLTNTFSPKTSPSPNSKTILSLKLLNTFPSLRFNPLSNLNPELTRLAVHKPLSAVRSVFSWYLDAEVLMNLGCVNTVFDDDDVFGDNLEKKGYVVNKFLDMQFGNEKKMTVFAPDDNELVATQYDRAVYEKISQIRNFIVISNHLFQCDGH